MDSKDNASAATPCESSLRLSKAYLVAMGFVLFIVAVVRVASPSGGHAHPSELPDLLLVYGVLLPSVSAPFSTSRLLRRFGARQLPFPSLSRLAFSAYLIGCALLIIADAQASPLPQAAWRTVILDSLDASSHLFASSGIALIVLSMAANATGIIVASHRMRPPGVSWADVDIETWALVCHSIVTLLATPLLLLSIAHAAVWPQLGSLGEVPATTTWLSRHLFWLPMHALFLASVLPIVGFAVQTLEDAGRDTYGRRRTSFTIACYCVLAFLGYQQQFFAMRGSDSAPLAASFFGLLTGATLAMVTTTALRHFSRASSLAPENIAIAFAILTAQVIFCGIVVVAASAPIGASFGTSIFGTLGRNTVTALVICGLIAAWSASNPARLREHTH